ncbi:MAG: ABC-2 transporter permease [Oscillospiraceae bacterium]|nr:ABC-2 transporter permease [Oscillospiraceae bacterium]
MSKALSFTRLDYITVKPYLTVKNLCIFVGVALIMLIVNSSAVGAIGFLMAFAAMYASYPFAIGEKSNIDVLYTTLSIKRNTVVLGRYLFAMTFDLLAGSLTFVFSFIVLTVMQKDFNVIEVLSTVPVLFFVFSIIQAIQLPLYFKLNYTKAKIVAYMPFIVFPLVVFVGSSFLDDNLAYETIMGWMEWMSVNPLTAALAGGAIWLAIILVSYKASVSFYQKREF